METQSTELQERITRDHALALEAERATPNTLMRTGNAMLMDGDMLDRMLKFAKVMSTAVATLPEQYRGKEGDCMAVVMQAMQWGINPYALAQKTFFVAGKIGYEAQLVNAIVTSMAPTKDRLHFSWSGPWDKIIGKFVERDSKTQTDKHGHPSKYKVPAWSAADEAGCECTVSATLKGEETPRALTLSMSQALTRNSTLWAEDPRQQLAYLATKRWARLYVPDVLLGVYTPDELEEIPSGGMRDMGAANEVDKPQGSGKAADVNARMSGKKPRADAPKVEDIITSYAGAKTADDIAEIHKKAAQLDNDEDKKKARAAARKRLDELATPIGKTFAQVEGMIKAAANVAEINLIISDVIPLVSGDDAKAELTSFCSVRVTELTPA